MHGTVSLQREVCARFRADFFDTPEESTLGIALPTIGSIRLNGLRHRPDRGTSGWFVWGGETLSDDPAFFEPMHVSHLNRECPKVLPYLGLPPGWRFLLAPGYEDVWFDESLLHA